MQDQAQLLCIRDTHSSFFDFPRFTPEKVTSPQGLCLTGNGFATPSGGICAFTFIFHTNVPLLYGQH